MSKRIAVLSLALLSACTPEPKTNVSPQKAPLRAKAVEFTPQAGAASRKFSAELFERLRRKSGNVVFSPTSIALALGAAGLGAEGETRAEIERVLGFGELERALHDLSEAMQGGGAGPTMRTGTRVFADRDLDLLPSYGASTQRTFGNLPEVTDLHAPSTSDFITEWMSKVTEGMIREPVKINLDTRILIVNATYFKGEWAEAFSRGYTRDAPFLQADGRRVDTKMMYTSREMSCRDGQAYSVVELPYKSSGEQRYVMDLVVPKDASLDAVETEMVQTQWGALDSTRSCRVDLTMPKGKVKAGTGLKDALIDMGVRRAMSSDAQFQSMSDKPLMIDQIEHKAVMRTDELGTEAAATTQVGIVLSSAPGPSVVVKADHPHLAIIREKTSGAVLFVARVGQVEPFEGS